MAGSAFAGEKMIIEENRGGAAGGEEGGLQHVYFFIPKPTVTVTPATPSAVVTREATQEIQASEVENLHPSIPPSMSAKTAGETEEPTVKVDVEDEAKEGDTIVQDNKLNKAAARLIQGEPISQAEGSLQHIYFFIPSAPPTAKEDIEDDKDIKNNTLTVFEIPTIIITAASAAPSRAPSQVGTEEDAEEAPATDSASEAEVKEEEEEEKEEAAPAEQTPTEAGNDPTDRVHDHVGKKLKTDMDSSVNVATNPSSPSGNRSPGRGYYRKKDNHNGKRSSHHRTPSPNNSDGKPYEKDYTSPSGQVFTKKELNELRFGVKNERGDTVFFKPSFIEDPWVGAAAAAAAAATAKENEEKREEGEKMEMEMEMGPPPPVKDE